MKEVGVGRGGYERGTIMHHRVSDKMACFVSSLAFRALLWLSLGFARYGVYI